MQSLKLLHEMNLASLWSENRQKFSISLNPCPHFVQFHTLTSFPWTLLWFFFDTSTSGIFQLQLPKHEHILLSYPKKASPKKQSAHFGILHLMYFPTSIQTKLSTRRYHATGSLFATIYTQVSVFTARGCSEESSPRLAPMTHSNK